MKDGVLSRQTFFLSLPMSILSIWALLCVFPSSLISENYAILIGISYQDTNSPLKYAESDTDYMKVILEEECYFDPNRIVVLKGKDATFGNIRSNILKMSNLDESDILLLYFSGHGTLKVKPNLNDDDEIVRFDKCLLVYDYDPELKKLITTELIQESDLKPWLARIKAKKVLIMDSCYSGGGKSVKKGEKFFLPPLPDSENDIISVTNAVLTASKSNQPAGEDDNKKQGVFTFYFAEALKRFNETDTNGDKKINIAEVYNYAKRRMREERHDQEPTLTPEDANLILVDKNQRYIEIFTNPENAQILISDNPKFANPIIDKQAPFRGLCPVGSYFLKIGAEGYEDYIDSNFNVESRVHNPLRVELKPLRAEVRGHIVDKNGRGLKGVKVSLRGPTDPRGIYETVTREDGGYELRPLLGKYTLVAELPGYKIAVHPDPIEIKSLTEIITMRPLTLEAESTSLTIQTNPPGAKATLDGTEIGTTPIQNVQITLGIHILQLNHPDYVVYEEKFNVSKNQSPLYIVLKPKPGRLLIKTSPDDVAARVYIDGDTLPKGESGEVIPNIQPGTHTIKVEPLDARHRSVTRNIEILPNRTREELMLLDEIKGEVYVDSIPQGAEIYVDDDQSSKGQTPSLISLNPGQHRIIVKLQGYQLWTTTLIVEGDKRHDLIPTPKLIANPGSLKVISKYKGKVWIDEGYVGETPYKNQFLSAGSHKVKLEIYIGSTLVGSREVEISMPPEGNIILDNIDPNPEFNNMVYILAGEFIMGVNSDLYPDAQEHKVYLRSFFIDKYEVTISQYQEFLDYISKTHDGSNCDPSEPQGYSHTPLNWDDQRKKDKDNLSVKGVSWYDAFSYARWAGKRLPTETEWEKAARGKENSIWPWGNDWSKFKANWIDEHKRPSPVGSAAEDVSSYGVYDMAGNVWEWVGDWYHNEYYIQSEEKDPVGPEKGQFKVVRGNLLKEAKQPHLIGCAFRDYYKPNYKNLAFGFRCAISEDDITKFPNTNY